MKHFSEQVWIDFVRGTGQARVNQKIETHLASKCPDCLQARSRWQLVYAIATVEPSFAAPDHLPQAVRQKPGSANLSEPAAWIMASTVFDSSTRPLTAGVRSGISDTRQMLFDAEGTMVDLLLEIHPQTNMVSLAGQVVCRPGGSPRKTSILSWNDCGQRLAKASANDSGEFQMEFLAQDRVRLSVEIVGSKPIRIPPLTLNREPKPTSYLT